LDHAHTLFPHLVDGSSNVHQIFLLGLLQDIVNADEGASAANASAAEKNSHEMINVGSSYLQ
jgi:hypothetical protein